MNEDLSKLEDLILKGAIEVDGLTDSGAFLYKFTNKLKDIEPGLYEAIQKKMYREIMLLWESGFITMDVTAENPIVMLTDKAFDKDALNELPEQIKANLIALMKSMSEEL
jgi:hypothetical protein